VVACGGTALTLLGYKESTRDVDLLVPIPNDYEALIRLLESLGYKPATGNGWKHPNVPWIFDLFRGQTIFQTELLDPIHEKENHRTIFEFNKLTLACLNPADLIISKMFRGTDVDVQDSVLMLKSEPLDLHYLAERYKETADYYYNPAICKTNLGYLIDGLDREGIDSKSLKEVKEQWT
jgi:hypothetical protein